MATRKPDPSRGFSNEELAKVLEVIKAADTVEIKLAVPMSAHRATVQSLGLDPVEAQPRQVFFFDTPELALNQAGLVVRARRIQGGRGDTVIKLRPVDPAAVDEELRRSSAFNVEVDVLPGQFVCSASLKGRCSAQEVLDVDTAAAPLSSIFSKEQRAFYKEHAPAGIEMDSLLALGPTFLLKAKLRPKQLDRRLVVEMWLYPDGSRSLEISTKCAPAEAFHVAAEVRAYLTHCGIEIGGGQQTKTKAALEFFKANLETKEPRGVAK
jgi:hypothetical protein